MKKGDKYNRLTAIEFHHRGKNSQQYWLFKCDCGNKKVLCASAVKHGDTKSCGCLKIEKARERGKIQGKIKIHGMSKTAIYNLWANMRDRCNNSNSEHYKDYGARGIKVCNRWQGKNGFQNFYKDIGKKRPSKEYSLDRIDGNKNYSLSNCRWATAQEQMDNRRDNRKINFKGGIHSVSQIAKMTGLKANVLWNRLFMLNWSIGKATATEVRKVIRR